MAVEKKKIESDNYYRILGTNSNVGQETIRERYVEKVREFPPEQYPDEFQLIRKAYDTLSNPLERSRYDLKHKYGGKVERLMDEAVDYRDYGNYRQAERNGKKALELANNNIDVLVFLGHISILQGNKKDFNQYFKEIDQLAPKNEKYRFLLVKGMMLVDTNYTEEALQVLKETEKLYPKHQNEYTHLYMHIYQELGRLEEVCKLIEENKPKAEEIDPENIMMYIILLNTRIEQEKWQEVEKVKDEIIKLGTELIDMEDASNMYMFMGALDGCYLNFYMNHEFKAAMVYKEIIMELNLDSDIEESLEELEFYASLSEEIDMLHEDMNMSPVISIEMFRLYYQEIRDDSALRSLERDIDNEEFRFFLRKDGEYVRGINYLKNNYPYFYNHYQEKWDEMYEEHYHKLSEKERSLHLNTIQAGSNKNYTQKKSGTIVRTKKKVGRNDPCPCGSGKKYKKCCS